MFPTAPSKAPEKYLCTEHCPKIFLIWRLFAWLLARNLLYLAQRKRISERYVWNVLWKILSLMFHLAFIFDLIFFKSSDCAHWRKLLKWGLFGKQCLMWNLFLILHLISDFSFLSSCNLSISHFVKIHDFMVFITDHKENVIFKLFIDKNLISLLKLCGIFVISFVLVCLLICHFLCLFSFSRTKQLLFIT